MNEISKFFAEVAQNIEALRDDSALHDLSQAWLRDVTPHKYAHNFTWMGRPIIQLPQDVMAMQELVWRIKPKVILETGVAHGGSLLFYASLLELLGAGRVIGVDIDIRSHNRQAIEQHPMAHRVTLIQGSSVDDSIVSAVKDLIGAEGPVLVALDSNHTCDHVLRELRAYESLVGKDSYIVVFDTAIENIPEELLGGRPWKQGNSPMTAVDAFLQETDRFVIDTAIDAKLLISVAPRGYLKCVKDVGAVGGRE